MRSRPPKESAENRRRKCTCFCRGIDLSAVLPTFAVIPGAARDDRPSGINRMPRPRICQHVRNLWIAVLRFDLSTIVHAKTLMPTPGQSPSAAPEEETIVPTFETQKLARTFMLDLPAPRGQIRDRNGV